MPIIRLGKKELALVCFMDQEGYSLFDYVLICTTGIV